MCLSHLGHVDLHHLRGPLRLHAQAWKSDPVSRGTRDRLVRRFSDRSQTIPSLFAGNSRHSRETFYTIHRWNLRTLGTVSVYNKSRCLLWKTFLCQVSNFTNILCTPFLYESAFHSFSLLTVWLCNLFGKRMFAQKLLIKCWRNWLKVFGVAGHRHHHVLQRRDVIEREHPLLGGQVLSAVGCPRRFRLCRRHPPHILRSSSSCRHQVSAYVFQKFRSSMLIASFRASFTGQTIEVSKL